MYTNSDLGDSNSLNSRALSVTVLIIYIFHSSDNKPSEWKRYGVTSLLFTFLSVRRVQGSIGVRSDSIFIFSSVDESFVRMKYARTWTISMFCIINSLDIKGVPLSVNFTDFEYVLGLF